MNTSSVVAICCSVSFLVGVVVGWKLHILRLKSVQKKLDYHEERAKRLKGTLLHSWTTSWELSMPSKKKQKTNKNRSSTSDLSNGAEGDDRGYNTANGGGGKWYVILMVMWERLPLHIHLPKYKCNVAINVKCRCSGLIVRSLQR